MAVLIITAASRIWAIVVVSDYSPFEASSAGSFMSLLMSREWDGCGDVRLNPTFSGQVEIIILTVNRISNS